MLKKIIVGGLFLALLGVLVAGAINRTLDKSESSKNGASNRLSEDAGLGQRKGNTRLVSSTEGEDNLAPGRSSLESGSRRQGQRNQDQLSEVNPGTGQAQVDEWLTMSGVVRTVDTDSIVVEIEGVEPITIENRPWWFAQDQGFSISIGDEILLEGFYEGDNIEVGQLTNPISGATVQIRLETGRPLWAGGSFRNMQS